MVLLSKFFLTNAWKLYGKINLMCFERNGFTPYFLLSWESVSGICAYQTKEMNNFPFPSTKICEPNEALGCVCRAGLETG
ncbi:hypothetical protein LguiB_033516 [Lonicera macranthoides]